MATEFYIGLAAFDGALLAIFAAAIFVLAQMGSDAFSPVITHFLLRRRLAMGLALVLGIITAFALAGAVRTAFPDIDALPGNWRTDTFLDSVWPAVGLVVATFLSLPACGYVLMDFAATLRGPGLVKAMAQEIKVEAWSSWLNLIDSDTTESDESLRQRYESGELSDPFASLFEIATVAIQTRRHASVESVLVEVRKAVDGWQGLPEGKRPDGNLTIVALLGHLNDLVDAALANQAVTPIEAVIRNVGGLALAAMKRQDSRTAVRICDELANWAGRLTPTNQWPAAVSAIRSIRTIAISSDEAENHDVFEQCALALGSAAEELAASHHARPRRFLSAGYDEPRYDTPLSSLISAFDTLTMRFTRYDGGVKGSIHNARFVLDALRAAALAFLTANQFDSHADEASASLIRFVGHLGLSAAKGGSREVVEMVVYELEIVGEQAQVTNASEALGSLAYAAFELGLNTEAMAAANGKDVSKLPVRLASVCERAGPKNVQEAVSGLFCRGHTMYVPDDAQRRFLGRVEDVMGRRFQGAYGDTSTGLRPPGTV